MSRTFSKILKILWRQKAGLVGSMIVVFMVIIALFAPYFAPHDPYDQQIIRRLKPPVWDKKGSWEFPLGTDMMGRDILSRLIYGARVSLAAGLLAVLIASVLGCTLGLVAGYYGGKLDAVIYNMVNIMMAFPFMLLALAAIAILGPNFRNLIIVLGITGWPLYTRVVRTQTLNLKKREYVIAATALGMKDLRIILGHILPNLLNSIIVIGSLEIAHNILRESFLSFLGLGIQPPIPSWGGMLGEGRSYMLMRWWLAAFPGMFIFVTTLGINLMGDGLRDLLDPHSQ